MDKISWNDLFELTSLNKRLRNQTLLGEESEITEDSEDNNDPDSEEVSETLETEIEISLESDDLLKENPHWNPLLNERSLI